MPKNRYLLTKSERIANAESHNTTKGNDATSFSLSVRHADGWLGLVRRTTYKQLMSARTTPKY
jgi:hypothetical protein